jgi:hypothetical protein
MEVFITDRGIEDISKLLTFISPKLDFILNGKPEICLLDRSRANIENIKQRIKNEKDLELVLKHKTNTGYDGQVDTQSKISSIINFINNDFLEDSIKELDDKDIEDLEEEYLILSDHLTEKLVFYLNKYFDINCLQVDNDTIMLNYPKEQIQLALDYVCQQIKLESK